MHEHQWVIDPGAAVNCKECTAECCKHIGIGIDPPTTHEDLQRIADWLHYANVLVYLDVEDDWIVEFKTRCLQLDGNKCRAWGKPGYPRICSEYEVSTCVMNDPGEYWKILLATPEDAAAYARTLGIAEPIRTTPPAAHADRTVVEVDPLVTWRDHDDMRWHLAHGDVLAFRMGERWFLELRTRMKSAPSGPAPVDPPRDEVLTSWEEIDARITRLGLTPPKEKMKLTGY